MLKKSIVFLISVLFFILIMNFVTSLEQPSKELDSNKQGNVNWMETLSPDAKNGNVFAQYLLAHHYITRKNGGSMVDTAIGHGWLCVLEKQILVKNSPSLDDFKNKVDSEKIFEIKKKAENQLKDSPLMNKQFQKICDEYIQKYYIEEF